MRRHALQFRDVQTTKRIKVEGERPELEGTVGSFELADRYFGRPRVTFGRAGTDVDATIPEIPEATTGFDGLIGNGLMRHFVVVFNYPARKIAFLPLPGRRPSPADRALHQASATR